MRTGPNLLTVLLLIVPFTSGVQAIESDSLGQGIPTAHGAVEYPPSQVPVIAWNWTDNSTQPMYGPHAIDVNAAGESFLAGVAGQGMRVAKLTSQGTMKWFWDGETGPVMAWPGAIVVDQAGNSYIAGEATPSGGGPNNRWIVVKLSPIGIQAWDWYYNPSPWRDGAMSIDLGPSGELAVAGFSYETPSPQWRVMRLWGNGTVDWTWTFDPTSGTDVARDVVVDSVGNIYVAGVRNGGYNNGGESSLVVKLYANGTEAWNWSDDPSPGPDFVTSIGLDPNGNVLVAGAASNGPAGDQQWRVAKLDTNGTLLWTWEHNPGPLDPNGDSPTSIAVDGSGYAYVGGWDVASVGADWHLAAIRPNGTLAWNWSEHYTNGNDYVNAVAVDRSGGIYAAGSDQSSGIPGEWRVVKFKYDPEDPSVVSTSPADGQSNVPWDASLSVVFNQPMNRSNTSAAFRISPALNGTTTVRDRNLTWNHTQAFSPATVYRVTILSTATSETGHGLTANYSFTFTTAPPPVPAITITDPPGFQLWRTNEQHNISWVSTDTSASAKVDLSYTAFGGASTPIQGDLPSNGTFVWTVPLTAIGTLTLRADLRDPAVVANATVGILVIPPFLVNIAPTAATVDMGARQMFTATAVSTTGQPIPQDQVAFIWQLSNASVASVDPPVGRYTNLTGLAVGTTSLTCLALYQGAGSSGLPAQVTVVAPPPPTVAVLAPNGGDAHDSDSPIEIRWRANASIFPLTLDVDYSLDGGGNFTRAASGISQASAGIKSVSWAPPADVETERAVVRVTAMDPAGSSGSDVSAEFAIRTPVELRAYSPLVLMGQVDQDADGLAVVQAVSRGGRSVPGIAISWSLISEPSGATLFSFNSSDPFTDGSGLASARLHLGEVIGDYLVQAEANGTTLLPVVFTATARPGLPSSVFIEPAQSTVNRGSTQQFKVTAYDAYSNLIEAPVSTWTVVGGIGVVDAAGLFTGERPGSGEVVATLAGESGPVTATAQVRVVETGIAAGALSILLLALLIPLIVLLVLFRKRIVRMVTGRPSRPKPTKFGEESAENPRTGSSEARGSETKVKAPERRVPVESPGPKAPAGSGGDLPSSKIRPAAVIHAARKGESKKVK